MVIFTLQQSLEFLENNTGSSDVVVNTKWLEETKATNGTYRPYYVAGMLLWLKAENNLIKGEGAEFGQNTETTRRFLVAQKIIDAQQLLEVPDQYKCDLLLAQISPNSNSNFVGFLSF